MKVTYNWLKDFVEIKISPKALAEKLTMAGLEVTSLEQKEGDFVFELEITSNRPDCLSVIGIAREVAAITNKKLSRYPVIPLSRLNRQTGKQANRLTISIENKEDCPLYTAKIIRDVKVGPSPAWLRHRLELIGCRSVNNIVDTTNYILFTWGEPLHAFNLDKLVSPLAGYPVSPLEIIIRRAKVGEEIVTIDGIKRTLNEETLIIASQIGRQTGKQTNRQTGKPVAIAGIMGGKNTGVTETTRNILLEAAAFNPIVVRRARRALGIQSDSSYRFERGVDLQIIEKASLRAVELIQKLAGARFVLAKSAGLSKVKRKSIHLEVSAVQKILGINIAAARIKKILNTLEFKTNPVRNTKSPRNKLKISNGAKTQAKNSLRVDIPSHRPDVDLEIDLIEEIARVSGFEFIPRTLPAVKPQVTIDQQRSLVSVIKNILIGLGLNEVITYSLLDKALLSNFGVRQDSQPIGILNPLSQEQEILRPQLIPSLAACVAYNLNQKQDYVNIFEVAAVFSQSSPRPKEELRLGIALCGSRSLLLDEGLIKETKGFLHLKGIMEVLFERLGVRDCRFKTREAGEIAVYVASEEIGFFARLAKNILESLDIKNKEVFVAELYLNRVLSYVDLNKKFTRLPVYPGISRDISVILKEEILVGDILEAIREKGGPMLREAKIVDYYKGKQIPSGFRGLTISCLYRADTRTLTEAEITPLHALLYTLLKDRFGAQIR